MKLNNDRFHIDEASWDRTCYHGYQSFDPKEKNLTPEQVHEMGVELVKRLYPNFQVLVSTHVDRGHLHNHFVINAVDMNGRKLEDRLANPKEGLYGLRDTSDQIALEHGLRILTDSPKIGRFRNNKYLYDIANKSWKSQIIEMLESLKGKCFTFDELLESLALEGYQIKSGKNIRIKPFGKQKFVTMRVLGEDYSEENLKKFFFNKTKNFVAIDFENYKLNVNNSELLNIQNELIRLSKESLLLTMQDLDPTKQYPKYYNSRYLEIKRYHRLVDTINFLNDNEIYHYEDLQKQIDEIKNDIQIREEEYKEQLSLNETLQLRVPLCELYLQYLDYYDGYVEQQEMSKEKIEMSEEVEAFLKIKKELQVKTTEDVKEIISNANRVKAETNRQYAYLSYLKTKASSLEKIRATSLETEKGFIKSITISKRMIDETRSNDEKYCIRIPYSELYIYIPKDNLVWFNYDNRAYVYLIDDKDYDLYNKENQVVQRITGEELEQVELEEKKKINELYKQN